MLSSFIWQEKELKKNVISDNLGPLLYIMNKWQVFYCHFEIKEDLRKSLERSIRKACIWITTFMLLLVNNVVQEMRNKHNALFTIINIKVVIKMHAFLKSLEIRGFTTYKVFFVCTIFLLYHAFDLSLSLS